MVMKAKEERNLNVSYLLLFASSIQILNSSIFPNVHEIDLSARYNDVSIGIKALLVKVAPQASMEQLKVC